MTPEYTKELYEEERIKKLRDKFHADEVEEVTRKKMRELLDKESPLA